MVSNAAKNIRSQTFPVPQTGRTLINRIEEQMDKRRKKMEDIVVSTGETTTSPAWVLARGRYEGMAASLAILRSTSVQTEISRSNKRLDIS